MLNYVRPCTFFFVFTQKKVSFFATFFSCIKPFVSFLGSAARATSKSYSAEDIMFLMRLQREN